MFDENEEINAK